MPARRGASVAVPPLAGADPLGAARETIAAVQDAARALVVALIVLLHVLSVYVHALALAGDASESLYHVKWIKRSGMPGGPNARDRRRRWFSPWI
jgi:hypothetical protein